MKRYNINGYTRISKNEARKLWNNGDNKTPIYFCPVNLRPGNPWNPETYFYKTGLNFDYAVAGFEFFNCTCSETGKYTAFYTHENDKKEAQERG